MTKSNFVCLLTGTALSWIAIMVETPERKACAIYLAVLGAILSAEYFKKMFED